MLVNANNDMILESLDELADIQLQERLWIGGEGSELSSLEETICALFDDSCLGMVLDKQECVYDEAIDAELVQLRSELGSIDVAKRIQDIVASAEWRQIAWRAGQLRQRIGEFLRTGHKH